MKYLVILCSSFFYALQAYADVSALVRSQPATYEVSTRLLTLSLQDNFPKFSAQSVEQVLNDLEHQLPVALLKDYPMFDHVSMLTQPHVVVTAGQPTSAAIGNQAVSAKVKKVHRD